MSRPPVAVGAGGCAMVDDGKGRGPSWAFARSAPQQAIVRLRRKGKLGIDRSDLSRNRAKSNVAPVMATLEMNLRHCFISPVAGGRDGAAKRGHREHPTTTGFDSATALACARVKNLDVFHLPSLIK